MTSADGTLASAARPGLLAEAAAEARETLKLAWPLIIAQFATVALHTTDVVMMGWLGPTELGAGALAASVLFTVTMFGSGVAMAVAPLVAQGLGARRRSAVRSAVRQGLWVAALLSTILTPALIAIAENFGALGQTAEVSALAGGYLRAAAWALPSMLMFVVLRGLVSAHGETGVVLAASLAAIAVNALGNYALMFGNFGLPRLELVGAAIATAATNLAMLAMLALWVLTRRTYRRYALTSRVWAADWARFREILRIGLPIGATLAAESGLFSAAAMLMGRIGPDALAAHAVALQIAAVAFMAPLGLSHATVIRVGLAQGEGRRDGARLAGWTSIALAAVVMGGAALLFWFAPEALIGLFLDADNPESAAPFALAVSFLGVAAVFQLVDGAQVTAAAALRGLSDTAAPMAIALGGYWVVGLPVGWLLGFPLGLEGIGVWLGLAAGLAVAALVLMARFRAMTRG